MYKFVYKLFHFAEGVGRADHMLIPRVFQYATPFAQQGKTRARNRHPRAGVSWRIGALEDVAVYTHALMAMKGSRVFVFLLLDISQQHHNSRKKLQTNPAKDQNPS